MSPTLNCETLHDSNSPTKSCLILSSPAFGREWQPTFDLEVEGTLAGRLLEMCDFLNIYQSRSRKQHDDDDDNGIHPPLHLA